jgi:hypothetical protein
LNIKGKERVLKFGNRALAEIERRYGTLSNFDKLQKDMETRPMETIPWLFSICVKDKEGIGDTVDDILDAFDDSDLLINDIAEKLGEAMNSAMSRLNNSGKKKAKIKAMA